MKDERNERIERTLDIFKDQMERILDKDYGLIVIFGDGTGGCAAVYGDNVNALSALSLSMYQSRDLRNMIESSVRALEHAERECE